MNGLIVAGVIVVLILVFAILKAVGRGKDTSGASPVVPAPPVMHSTHVPSEEQQYVSVLRIPLFRTLPPNDEWENRFEVPSTTSSEAYVVSQNIHRRFWGCSCRGWTFTRHCKHLDALCLPPLEKPHEVHFESTADESQPAPQAIRFCPQPIRTFPPELSDSPIDLSSTVPRRFVVFDLETTGLDAAKHEIIEIGAIRVDITSHVHDSFETLAKPVKRIPKHITQKTGISQSMVDLHGEPLETVMNDFAAFIGNLPLVSFNADFDMRFLRNAAKLHNLVISNRVSCALKMVRRAWPGLPSYKLVEIAKLTHMPAEDSHRALGDCKRTIFVYTGSATKLGFTFESKMA